MAYNSTTPLQRQLYPSANPSSPATNRVRPISRVSSAKYASAPSTSNVQNAALAGGTSTGTPLRRPNKRSSVTVVCPDAVSPGIAPSPCAAAAAVGGVNGSYSPRGMTAAVSGGSGGAPAAGAAESNVAVTAMPIPVAPKRPSSISSCSSGVLAAATAAAAASASPRTRVSADFTTSTNTANIDARTTAMSGADGNASCPPRDAAHAVSQTPPLPTLFQSTTAAAGTPASRVTSATVTQRAPTPSWLHSPALTPMGTSGEHSRAAAPGTAMDGVTAASAPPAQQAWRTVVPVISPSRQQRQQEPTQLMSNTNGLCESIVDGVRHAAGNAGLWGPTAGSGLPFLLSPSPSSLPLPVLPSTSAIMTASNLTTPASAAAAAEAGRRSSGRYTGPALQQYTTSGDSGHVSSEKRTSVPFAFYSTDLLAAELARQSSSAGAMTIAATTQTSDDTSHTGDLLSQQPWRLQQMQQLGQQCTAATCNDELQRLLREARQAYQQAESRLLDDGLSLMEDWMRTRDLFFSAGSLFAAVGDAETSARCLLHATFINRAFRDDDEALTTLALSVDQLKRTHPRVAVDSLLRLAPCYARRKLRYQTARCYRDAAEILETELLEREAAVDLYRVALDTYADTLVAARKLARTWERRQPQGTQDVSRTSATGNRAVAVQTPAAVTATNTTTAEETHGGKEMDETKGFLSPSISLQRPSDVDVTQLNLKAGLPPPHYQVSTTVQRSLVEACRGRLLVLLTLLHRYPEVLDVALTCAEAVPRALPRTKYLLCATLSVLARGAPPPSPSQPGDAAEEAKTTIPGGPEATSDATPSCMSAEAEMADTLYFDSLYDTEKIFAVLQEEDRTFHRGKENELVRALLAANKACSLTMFDEAVRTYKAYATTEPSVVLDSLLEQCRHCLFLHVERFA